MNEITPNFFASFVLLCWPLVSFFFYRFSPLIPATLWTILAGQLFLPVGAFFKFEMVPLFDKTSIPNLCALFGCMIVTRRPIQLWTRFGAVEVILSLYLLSPIITSLLNGDPIRVGTTILPGVGLYDGISTLLTQFIVLIPFFLGRQFFRSSYAHYQILNVLAVAGIGYSLLLLFEVRFSPQLHFWLYGYYPSDFIQQIRGEGEFRPMVFMGHGLAASFFAMTALVASAALWRSHRKILGMNAGSLATYLGVVLYLCKSAAALIYGFVLTPLVRWSSVRAQTRVAILLASLALLYPLLRISEIFPTSLLVNVAGIASEDRASSLQFRFRQEDDLLNHASERFWFGWGRYGRSRVFREDWQGVGVDTSVTDGRWIISFGQFGLVGFLAEFSLLGFPIYRLAKVLTFDPSRSFAPFLASIGLILSVNIIDLLPNSSLTPWTWMLAGSLLGWIESVRLTRQLG